MRGLAMIVLLGMCGWVTAQADVIVLRNGGTIEGIVTDEGERVRVEMEFGTLVVPREQVREIRLQPSMLAEYRRRSAALRGDDPAGHFTLGVWAQMHDLSAMARAEYNKVIALDPEHQGARVRLGFEKIDGRWLSHDEAMSARGYVPWEGGWITREDAEMRREIARREALRAAEQRAEEQERRRRLEVARQEERLERARLERELAQRDSGYAVGYGYGSWVRPWPIPGYRHHVPWVGHAFGIGYSGSGGIRTVHTGGIFHGGGFAGHGSSGGGCGR